MRRMAMNYRDCHILLIKLFYAPCTISKIQFKTLARNPIHGAMWSLLIFVVWVAGHNNKINSICHILNSKSQNNRLHLQDNKLLVVPIINFNGSAMSSWSIILDTTTPLAYDIFWICVHWKIYGKFKYYCRWKLRFIVRWCSPLQKYFLCNFSPRDHCLNELDKRGNLPVYGVGVRQFVM